MARMASNSIGKTELVRIVSERTRFPREDVLTIVDAIFGSKGVIPQKLRAGVNVVLPGFGSFRVKDLPWRDGRNPGTQEAVRVAPTRKVRFKVSEKLRTRVARGIQATPDPTAAPVRPTPRKGTVPPGLAPFTTADRRGRKAPPPKDEDDLSEDDLSEDSDPSLEEEDSEEEEDEDAA